MKYIIKSVFLLGIMAFALTSCFREDPGPQQNDQKNFSIVDFDKLEASEALDITVQQGSIFWVNATGDSRNLNDLDIHKDGGTLVMKFITQRNRQYTTYVTITMPTLTGLSFSWAVNGKVTGFNQDSSNLDVLLSGASVAQIDATLSSVNSQVTGASQLRLNGTCTKMNAVVSGASLLSAFDFTVQETILVVSGASHAKIMTTQKLNASVSGASGLLYRGDPIVDADVTGASSFGHD